MQDRDRGKLAGRIRQTQGAMTGQGTPAVMVGQGTPAAITGQGTSGHWTNGH